MNDFGWRNRGSSAATRKAGRGWLIFGLIAGGVGLAIIAWSFYYMTSFVNGALETADDQFDDYRANYVAAVTEYFKNQAGVKQTWDVSKREHDARSFIEERLKNGKIQGVPDELLRLIDAEYEEYQEIYSSPLLKQVNLSWVGELSRFDHMSVAKVDKSREDLTMEDLDEFEAEGFSQFYYVALVYLAQGHARGAVEQTWKDLRHFAQLVASSNRPAWFEAIEPCLWLAFDVMPLNPAEKEEFDQFSKSLRVHKFAFSHLLDYTFVRKTLIDRDPPTLASCYGLGGAFDLYTEILKAQSPNSKNVKYFDALAEALSNQAEACGLQSQGRLWSARVLILPGYKNYADPDTVQARFYFGSYLDKVTQLGLDAAFMGRRKLSELDDSAVQ